VPEAGLPRTLQEILASGEPLPLERALAIVRGAALAIDAMHARQAIHGSIDLTSLQVEDDGRVTLRPPGTGPVADDGPVSAGEYWSPQQHAGEPARRSDDLFALGLIAGVLLTGRRLSELQAGAPRPPGGPSLPTEIEAVVRAQLSWAPSERFASGAELARELERAAARANPPLTQMSPARPEGEARGEGGSPLPLREGSHEGSSPLPRRTGEVEVRAPSDHEPAWAAAIRVAQAREARRPMFAELPDRGRRERIQPVRTAHHPIQRRDYPDFPLPGGWVAVLVVVLCSVYLFPIYYMLFPHG
jgi:serine/threonine protein kinase